MINRKNSITRLAVAVLVTAGIAAQTAPAAKYAVNYINLINMPTIETGRMVYSMDIVFHNRPNEYWAYYDEKAEMIVIDFYGVSLSGSNIKLPESNVFKSFEIKNIPTKMVLSGERSQLLIGADKGWHIDARSSDERIVRLTVWRPLRREVAHRKSPMKILWVILIPVTLAAATIFLVLRVASD